MKRKELIETLRGIDLDKVVVIGSSAMNLRGIVDENNDIDVVIVEGNPGLDPEVFDYKPTKCPGIDTPEDYEWIEMDGLRVQVQTLQSMLKFYTALNRPKDQVKIKMLKELCGSST